MHAPEISNNPEYNGYLHFKNCVRLSLAFIIMGFGLIKKNNAKHHSPKQQKQYISE